MRLVFAMILASGCASSWAQSAAPAGPAAASMAKYVETPEMKDSRLLILTTERADVQKKLRLVVSALPQAPDQKEAIEGITRLQTDLQALDREILRVESKTPPATAAMRKPAAGATGDVSQDAGKSDKSDSSYQAWDVFKNFGKKAN